MLKSFLNFDNFITPRIITIIYWLQIAGVAIFSLMIMFSGIGADIYYSGHGSFYRPSLTFWSFLLGIFFFVIGVLMVRVVNEIVIVLFRIQEHLKAIRKKNNP